MDGSEDLITIGFTDAAILDEQVLRVLGEVRAMRILKADAQSVSRGGGSFCGYPSQARLVR